MRGFLAEIGRSLRRFFFHLLVPAVLVALLAWQLALPAAVEIAARAWLADAGLPGSDLDVDTIALGGAEVSEVSLAGGALTADTIAVTYEPESLRRGRIGRAVVTGLRWRTRLVNGRLDLGPFAALGDGGGAPPVAEVALRDALVTIEADFGAIELPLSGRIVLGENGLSGRFDVRPRAAFGGATVAVELDVAPAGALDAYVEISDGWLHAGDATALGLSAQIAVSARPERPLEATAYVGAAHIDTPLGDLPGAATLVVADGRGALALDLVSGDRALALSLSADGALAETFEAAVEARLTVPSAAALKRRSLSLIGVGEPAPRIGLHGTVRADLAALAAGTLAAVSAEATLDLALAGVSVPRVVDGLGAEGTLAVTLSDEALMISGEGLRLSASSLDGEWLGLAADSAFAGYLARGAALRLTQRAAPLLHLASGTVTAAGDLRLALGDSLALRAGADRVSFGPGLRLERVDGAEIALERWDARPLGLALRHARVSAAGTGEALRGRAVVEAAGDLALGDFVAPGSRIRFDADLAYSDRRLSARLRDPDLAEIGPIVAEDIAVAPVAVRAAGPGVAEASLDDGVWRGSLALDSIELGVEGDTARGTAEAKLHLPPLAISADGDLAAGRIEARLAGEGGSAEARLEGELMPGAPLHVRADGIDVSLAGAAGGPATLTLAAETIAHVARRPLLVPLSLSLTASRDGDEAAFEGRLTEGSGNMVIDVAGRHRLTRGQGTGTLTLYPILFLEDGFQPGRLSPYFAPRLGPSTGSVALAGPLAWSDEGLSGALVLTLKDLTTVFDEVDVVGVNAAITFDRVLPPSTPPSQLVALAGIDLGLPLTDGLVAMRLDRDGRPLVERSEWRWAGGKVGASFTRRDKDGELLVLEIDGIGLDQLLDLTPQATNIEATGTLYGRIPVVFREGAFVIVDGWLESDFDGGMIRYAAEELEAGLLAGGEGVILMLEALDDFRYSRLRVDLDGLAGGETEMRFRIRGSNPELYGGAEIEFNMSVTGKLEQIFRQSYEAYKVPEEVARKLARAAGRGEDGE